MMPRNTPAPRAASKQPVVLPVKLDAANLVMDTPAVSLDPSAFSNMENMRFRDGAVRKMEGELEIFTSTNIAYIAYWQAPSNNYYIVAQTDGDILAYDADDLDADAIAVGSMSVTGTPVWQHTLFNGGFNFILNNGVTAPTYLSDPVGAGSLATLPNWESYLSQERVINFIWDDNNPDILLPRPVDFTTENLVYQVIPRDISIANVNASITTASTGATTPFTLTQVDNTSTTVTPRARSATDTGAAAGDTIIISIQTKAAITVTAGVIRSFNNLLVAGNLMERDSTGVVRSLTGVVRTSDVAAPGTVPSNWNPFREGANTADDFTLSGTGVIRDMAELQGVLFVYTDTSIHSIQQTGRLDLPIQFDPITDSYGATT